MTQEILRIAIFQLDLDWENPASNRAKIDEWLQKAEGKADIVFLPEMFTSGFSMNVQKMAESMDGGTVQWMKQRCKEHQLAICGSLMIADKDQYYNRLLFVEPSGSINSYDKRHLFTMANEESHFKQGNQRLIIQYKGWRICPLICYDLRFPVWARNRNDYDLLVYSANWPQNRKEVWTTLLKARAIENQTCVVGANRVGIDGAQITYAGNSMLIDPKGKVVAECTEHTENIVIGEFSYSELQQFRSDFPILNDADPFLIEN